MSSNDQHQPITPTEVSDVTPRVGAKEGGTGSDESKAKWKRRLILILLSLLILAFEEWGWTRLGLRAHEVAVMAKLYYPLVRFGYPPDGPKHTAVLEVSPHSAKTKRAFRRDLTMLLHRIEELDVMPRVIVFDFALEDLRYQPDEPYDPQTSGLVEATHRVCKKTPLIFGFFIHKGARPPQVEIAVNGKGSLCEEAFINSENDFSDFRHLPLSTVQDGREYSSLAYAAASAFDYRVVRNTRVRESLQKGTPLYTRPYSFQDYKDRLVHADQLFNGSLSEEIKQTLRNSILVIGDPEEDLRPTPAGELSGHVLQASYIESLVSGWLLKDLSKGLQFILGSAFLVGITFVESRLVQLAFYGSLLIGLALVNLVLMHFFGWQGDFELISVAGIFVWVIEQLVHVQEYFRK